MAAPTKLFLEFNDIDGKFHVNDSKGFAFGAAYEIPDAVQSARAVSNAPISFGTDCAGTEEIMVPKKPEHYTADKDVFIAELAEIGGMKATKVYDDNMNFIGYTMDLADEDTRAELAAEAHENEIVSAMSSYLEDD